MVKAKQNHSLKHHVQLMTARAAKEPAISFTPPSFKTRLIT